MEDCILHQPFSRHSHPESNWVLFNLQILNNGVRYRTLIKIDIIFYQTDVIFICIVKMATDNFQNRQPISYSQKGAGSAL